MSEITIFIKADKPSVVVTERGGGILNPKDDKVVKLAFGTEPRRIDMDYAEFYEAIKPFEDKS